MLLASRGGVCSLFGDKCCTFIPNNTESNGSFSRAMSRLDTLAEEMHDNAGHDMWELDWFDTMFRKWGSFFVKLGIGLLIGLIIIALLANCHHKCQTDRQTKILTSLVY